MVINMDYIRTLDSISSSLSKYSSNMAPDSAEKITIYAACIITAAIVFTCYKVNQLISKVSKTAVELKNENDENIPTVEKITLMTEATYITNEKK